LAISPTTDIVLDVARAADTASIEAARARLEKIARTGAAAAAGEAFRAAGEVMATRSAGAARSRQVPETFVKFEAMVLQTFLQSMLPEESEAVYGQGLAGDMWKSFLAKELGTQMARAGGIGIADKILGDYYMSGKTKVPVAGVDGGPEKAETDAQDLLSVALVQEIQRNITRTIGENIALRNRPSEP